jgi:transcriptional regulator with XRE-family HTH domain
MRRVEIRRPQDIGLAVAEARHSAGLTQAQLSEDCGVDRTYLAKLESGVNTLLLSRLLRLLRRLDAHLVVEIPDDTRGRDVDGGNATAAAS